MNSTQLEWQSLVGVMTVGASADWAGVCARCAVELGADVHVLDLRTVMDAQMAMVALAERLRFPEYFGHNLDALFDMIGECADVFQGQLDIQKGAVPHIWLIQSTKAQEKVLYPILDVFREAMSEFSGRGLSVFWWVD